MALSVGEELPESVLADEPEEAMDSTLAASAMFICSSKSSSSEEDELRRLDGADLAVLPAAAAAALESAADAAIVPFDARVVDLNDVDLAGTGGRAAAPVMQEHGTENERRGKKHVFR